jgi:parallel beta-helix repeat protein
MKIFTFLTLLGVSSILIFQPICTIVAFSQDASFIYVDDDNSDGPWDGSIEHPYRYITDAISVAQIADTIFVFGGFYDENLIINKPLTILGESWGTIIQSDSEDAIILIKDTESVIIENISVNHFPDSIEKIGTGISINNSISISILHSVSFNNEYGIVIESQSNDCILSGNTIVGNYIGIDICGSTDNLVYANQIQNNTIGFVLFSSSGNVLTENSITNSTQKPYFKDSTDTIDHNFWDENTAVYFFTGRRTIQLLGILIPWIKCDWNPAALKSDVAKYPLASMETSMGTMILMLYDEQMPITSSNFIRLSESGFYTGIVFHRVIDDFVIQGGGYDANGIYKESPFGTIDLEIHPEILHVDGAISMARTNEPNSATSQFFICDGAQSGLDGAYAAFGKIILGFDTLRAIASVETMTKHGFNKDWPVDEIVISDVTIIHL